MPAQHAVPAQHTVPGQHMVPGQGEINDNRPRPARRKPAHTHSHAHGTTAGGSREGVRKRLLAVLGLSAVVLALQVVGAIVSGSLALLADAGHVLTDMAGVSIALVATTLASRPATDSHSFGYHRYEILAAALNAMLLTGIAVAVGIGAWQRWQTPHPVDAPIMAAFAIAGLAANSVGILLLRAGAADSLNVRGAYLEVLGDAVGSAAVVVAAGVIWATGNPRVDVGASVLVVLLILPRAWVLLREAIDVLLEATPRDLDPALVRAHICDVPGVVDVHDLHVWAISSRLPVLSAHVTVTDQVLANGSAGRLLDELSQCLAGHFDVAHSTFQLEPRGHRNHEPDALHT